MADSGDQRVMAISGSMVVPRARSSRCAEPTREARSGSGGDTPELSTRSARWRRLLLAVALTVATLIAGSYLVGAAAGQGITAVRIAGEFRYLSQQALRERVNEYLRAGFFGLNVAAVRDAVLALPWVRDASVRRVWPDSLHIAVVERQPAARWGDDGLLESDGTLFSPEVGGADGLADLPVLRGPVGSHHRVLKSYREVRQWLDPLRQSMRWMSMSARGALRVGLGNGTTLVLGSAPTAASVSRFAQTFDALLAERSPDVEQIDLRYVNGFAVRWKESAVTSEG